MAAPARIIAGKGIAVYDPIGPGPGSGPAYYGNRPARTIVIKHIIDKFTVVSFDIDRVVVIVVIGVTACKPSDIVNYVAVVCMKTRCRALIDSGMTICAAVAQSSDIMNIVLIKINIVSACIAPEAAPVAAVYLKTLHAYIFSA